MKVDKERLKRIAERDPSVDIEKMEHFLNVSYKDKEPEVHIEKFSTSGDDSDVENFIFSPIRGATSRPGMGSPSFVKDILKNRPDLDDDYIVWRSDPIPLKTYKKMSHDPEIAFGVFLLKGWIGGLPYEVKARDPKIKAIVGHILKDKWQDLIRDLLDAIENGWAFGEKVWERSHVMIPHPTEPEEYIYEGPLANLKKVKFLDPENNFIFYKRNDELTKIEQHQYKKVVEVKRDKIVWFALDKKFSNLFGKSRFKNVYSSWYYGEVIEKYMLSDLQKRGSPHIEIRYPMGNSEVDGVKRPNNYVAELLAKKLTSQGYVVLPSETHDNSGNHKWTVSYGENHQQATNPYVEVLNRLNDKKLKGLGVPPSVAGGANFSAADAGADLLMIVIEDIVNQLESAIQKEIVDYIVDYNFGPKYKSQVQINIDKNALGRRDLIKELLKTMLRTGTSIKGHTLRQWPDVPAMARELGVNAVSFEEVFMEQEGMDRKEGETPVDEAEKDEDSNDTDVARGEEDNRDRGRATKRDSATST